MTNPFIEDQKKKLLSYITEPDISLKVSDLHIFPRTPNIERIFNVTKCPASTTLKAKRDYFTGEIIDFVEVPIKNPEANSRNSTSFNRAPDPEDSVRGNPMNYPFWPGGFDEPLDELKDLCSENFDFNDEPLLTVPPGFTHGYNFADENETPEETKSEDVVDLLSELEKDFEVSGWLDLNEEKIEMDEKKIGDTNVFTTNNEEQDSLLEALEPVPILQISQCSSGIQYSSEWAEIIDTTKPVTDFEEKIPEPALTFPFELDNFQKQAIIKLEDHQYVFIAAHTSAGKTVIAEYAIALSQEHMTRTIYTSPIKALSNQKYRDFKKAFKDVGLITGDLQINPTALCLIMTTEILRSMLFCGSDVARDLEYVIFDEVHYINDPDRGHVWEEVIMLLPKNVSIIMLSATVPNVKDLAEWVGIIKERKVYVISTLKRPIPLEHYLYVDSGGKKKENMHMIVDSKNQFLVKNFNDVKTEIDEKIAKKGKIGGNNPKEEQRKWSSLIDYLQKNGKLPVIAFTLSRNRCDSNAVALSAKDLNTGKEKAAVHNFFQQCIAKLKPEDRVLKQVSFMKESLERGIGIHHSGILPILKEIVEMAFQFGWVKVLFATETFAMGVNMPARSVVFDSFKKHDGTELRILKPSEYTQMAGRAGRRGHDETGTVIIFCKQMLPSPLELQNMILGRADLLLSKFRLRYAAILKCLCYKNIRVENIMKNSFKEFKFKKEGPSLLKHLEEIEEEFSKIKDLDKSLQPLEDFFNISDDYLSARQSLIKKLLQQPNYLKEIKPGKLVIVTFDNHYNKLGIILTVKFAVKPKETTLKVLVLDDQQAEKLETKETELWHNMLSLTKEMKFFKPVGAGGHNILEIEYKNIVELTKSNIKIEPELIIKNWEQRQIERFRDTPPSQSVQKAVAELNQINENYISKPNSIQIIALKKELNLNVDDAEEFSNLWKTFSAAKEKLQTILPYTNIANFQAEFKKVFEKKMLEKKLENLKFQNSPKSLSLYADYCDKLNVLKELRYIDENDVVLMKGKLACEMGQNELFITELICSNTFDGLMPTEIAALLSGLVFQAKTNVKVNPPNEKVKNAKERFEKIYEDIESVERKYNLHPGLENRLNFGLIEVVYDWANNKPFSDITKITDIQEGIIVRCIQQLDETIQDVRTAAIRFGNTELQQKMEDASKAIKRDIVFAASLYTEI